MRRYRTSKTCQNRYVRLASASPEPTKRHGPPRWPAEARKSYRKQHLRQPERLLETVDSGRSTSGRGVARSRVGKSGDCHHQPSWAWYPVKSKSGTRYAVSREWCGIRGKHALPAGTTTPPSLHTLHLLLRQLLVGRFRFHKLLLVHRSLSSLKTVIVLGTAVVPLATHIPATEFRRCRSDLPRLFLRRSRPNGHLPGVRVTPARRAAAEDRLETTDQPAHTSARIEPPGVGRTIVFWPGSGCVGAVVFRPAWLNSPDPVRLWAEST